MAVDQKGQYHYYNDYEVTDFRIRFPHLEKNGLFMPVIHYEINGEERYERIYMPLGDWFRLFRQEGINPETDVEDSELGFHFVKAILIHREGRYFESYEIEPPEEGGDEDEYKYYKKSGGGEFDGLDADWFILKSE